MNDYTQLNQGMGGDVMDETGVAYSDGGPPIRKRARVVMTGEGQDQVASVINQVPTGTEFALVVRNIPSLSGAPVVLFGETAAVPSRSETTVVSYTVPPGFNFSFLGFTASGQLPGLYKLYSNATPQLASRSTVADLNVVIAFPSPVLVVPANYTLLLTVSHTDDGLQGDFDGTILGHNIAIIPA